MMPPPHDLPLPGLQQLRTVGTAAPPPPYTGGGTGALGRAAPPGTGPRVCINLRALSVFAYFCIDAALLSGSRLGALVESPRSSTPPDPPLPASQGPRETREFPRGTGMGGIRVGLTTLAGLGRGASAEGQRWHLLGGCPAGARHHPGINRERLWELRKEKQQRTWLRSSLLVGVGADVIPG